MCTSWDIRYVIWNVGGPMDSFDPNNPLLLQGSVSFHSGRLWPAMCVPSFWRNSAPT